MSVLVWFWLGEKSDSSTTEPLLQITLPVLPRIGEVVSLPVKHEAEPREYQVFSVTHRIAVDSISVDVHVR